MGYKLRAGLIAAVALILGAGAAARNTRELVVVGPAPE